MNAFLVVAALLAAAPVKPLVAVLYFDNNTGQPEMDMLRKGFADMVVTDLAAAPGLQVVEREKLQALLDELKLQRTGFFDQETAVKLGKGLGATHVVTGAFATADPEMRLDVRLVDLESARVVVADKVVGKKAKVFELEQALVRRFLAAMQMGVTTETPRPGASWRAVLEYSRALDLADGGNLAAAQEALQGALKQAPTFHLAKDRLLGIVQKLHRARVQRGAARENLVEELRRSAQLFVDTHDAAKDSQADVEALLAYRYLLATIGVWRLRPLLSPGHPGLVVEGLEEPALAVERAFEELMRGYISGVEAYNARFQSTQEPRMQLILSNFRLPDFDERGRASMHFKDAPSLHSAQTAFADYLLNGRLGGFLDDELPVVWPPPAVTRPELAGEGTRLLQQAITRVDDISDPRADVSFLAQRPREVLSEFHLHNGRTEDAIAALQDFLDRYPRAQSFDRVEHRIKQLSGLAHDATLSDLRGYAPAVEKCDDMPIRKGLGEIINARIYTMGWEAFPFTARELDAPCAGRKSIITYVYSHLALDAHSHGSCALFTRYMNAFEAAGGSRSDAAGYRKNYAPECQAAPVTPVTPPGVIEPPR